MKISDRVLKIEESVTLASDAKAKKLKAEGKDILFLTLGQPDFTLLRIFKMLQLKSFEMDGLPSTRLLLVCLH